MCIVTGISELLACSCIGNDSVKEAVKKSDAVIVGTIISQKLMSELHTELYPPATPIMQYSFVCETIYKGVISSDTISIFTGIGNGDCGVKFTVGEKYIIYGQKETYFTNNAIPLPKGKNILWTHSCSRTRVFRQEEIIGIKKYEKRQYKKILKIN
jgi:hypothetical protein